MAKTEIHNEKPDFLRLQAIRDEIALKAHLMKEDLRQEWHDLDTKWQKIVGDVKGVQNATLKSKDDVSAAAELLMSSVQEGFKRIRKAMTH